MSRITIGGKPIPAAVQAEHDAAMKEYEEQLFQALIRSGKGKAVKRGAKKHEDDLSEAPVARSRGDVNRASSKEVKMVPKDRALVGAAGVHYVALQLSARGYAGGITAPGVKLVDLMATNTVTGKSVSLQVKTMTDAKVSSKRDPYWKWWLNEKLMSSKGSADLLIALVDFRGGATQESVNLSWSPDVFIVRSKDLKRVRASNSADGWFCLPERLSPDHRNR